MGHPAAIHQATEQDAPIDQAQLVLLRMMGLRCRAMARADLFEACAVLAADPTRAREACAVALLRAFSGLGDMPKLRLYEVTAPELSFDERWLLSALAAAERGDGDSLTFLLARRVPPHARRQVGFLVQSLARAVSAPRDAAA